MTEHEQAKLGILMLDTKFPRIPGDIGNASTWPFPVEYAVIPGATAQAIVCEDTSAFVDAFVSQGKRLVANGCRGIATTCGFLALIRPQLAKAIGVPVAASALEQAGQIAATLAPDRTLGILTISKTSLSLAHLQTAGAPCSAYVAGVEGTSFGQTILNDLSDLDVAAAEADLVEAACQLQRDAPQTGALLLECTNMVPYSQAIRHATGLPVYSIYTYLMWFQHSLSPPVFPRG